MISSGYTDNLFLRVEKYAFCSATLSHAVEVLFRPFHIYLFLTHSLLRSMAFLQETLIKLRRSPLLAIISSHTVRHLK